MLLRLMLAGIAAVGLSTWCRPSIPAWGALASSLLVLWTLWLTWRTHAGDGGIPGHPLYVALVGPLAIVLVHFFLTGLADTGQLGLNGSLNASLVMHILLIQLTLLLTQSLSWQAEGVRGLLLVVAGAMILGGGLTLAMTPDQPARSALCFQILAGAVLLVAGAWSPPPGAVGEDRAGRYGLFALAAAIAATTAVFAPGVATVTAGLAGGVLLVAAVFDAGIRRVLLPIGAGLVVVAIAAGYLTGLHMPGLPGALPAAFGEGETGLFPAQAAAEADAGPAAGYAVCLRVTGWFGAGWLAVGAVISLVLLVARAREGDLPMRMRTAAAATAAGAMTLAFCAPGGHTVPAVSLGLAVSWGLLSRLASRRPRRVPGVLLLLALVAFFAVLALARRPGLFYWVAQHYGLGEHGLHALGGFLLALVFAWLMGRRRWYWGLGGILLSVAAGAAGEVMQARFSTRSQELADFFAHAIGAAVAAVPYLLAIASRACESKDAQRLQKAREAYGRAG